MPRITLKTFTEEEYHAFFRGYVSDPLMDAAPFVYSREQVSRSYIYNHSGVRENYVHLGVFLDCDPVGNFQLKRLDAKKKTCEFGIILQNDRVKNRGIGTEAIRQGMILARDQYGMETMIGDTMGRNAPMRRVFEKLGFTLFETVPFAFHLSDGTVDDRLVYRKNMMEGIK